MFTAIPVRRRTGLGPRCPSSCLGTQLTSYPATQLPSCLATQLTSYSATQRERKRGLALAKRPRAAVYLVEVPRS